MSSSRRNSVACIAALALGGCMKIYPDPELPDIEAHWYEGDCRPGANVTLSLLGIDDTTFRADLTVACADTKATFADVPRKRYRLDAKLHTADGAELGTYNEDLDLRNGLDERADLFFGSFSNLIVAWRFDMGATCASLAADSIELEFVSTTFPAPLTYVESCAAGAISPALPDGLFTVMATAITADGLTVAVSPVSPQFAISFEDFAQVELVLSPCGDQCPTPTEP